MNDLRSQLEEARQEREKLLDDLAKLQVLRDQLRKKDVKLRDLCEAFKNLKVGWRGQGPPHHDLILCCPTRLFQHKKNIRHGR